MTSDFNSVSWLRRREAGYIMPERQQQREEKKQDTGAGGLEGREARGGSRQGARTARERAEAQTKEHEGERAVPHMLRDTQGERGMMK